MCNGLRDFKYGANGSQNDIKQPSVGTLIPQPHLALTREDLLGLRSGSDFVETFNLRGV